MSEQGRTADILETAEAIFAEKGYHATNISDIAQRLEMGHGTFYRYFKNKLDIFSRVVDRVILRITETLSDEDPNATNTLVEYRAQVERIGSKLMALFLADTHLAKLIFYEALGIDEAINDKVRRAMDAIGSITEAYLRNGMRKGFLRADLDSRITALAINAMILESAKRVVHSPEREEVAKQWTLAVADLMFRGLAGAG